MKCNIKYVAEDTDRHGNVRVYFRKRGCIKIRLHGKIGSPEFWLAYNDAVNNKLPVIRAEPRSVREKAGSMRALVVAYYTSAEFKALDSRTQNVRRRALDRFCEKHGHLPAKEMLPRHILAIRDRISETPEAANQLLKFLRQVFAHAVIADLCDRNPARDIPYLKSQSEGLHSWTIDEVEQFEATHPVGTMARLAMALMLYTGQRRSDAVLFGPSHMRNSWLTFTQQKNRNKKPIHLEIPVRSELLAILSSTATGKTAFLTTEFGKPFSANGFGNWFRKKCDEAGLPHCTAHGLRKAAAARLAELGAPENEIMAITGHRTSKEITRYTRGARQRILAEHAFARHDSINVSHLTEENQSGAQGNAETPEFTDDFKMMVPRGGIEPPTQRFSVACSTN
jgi:integrase